MTALLIGCCTAAFSQPKAPIHEVVDNYFGQEIRDPYRYMEQGTPEAMAWLQAQREYTGRVLAGLPERDPLRRRLQELDQQLGARFQFVTKLPDELYIYSKASANDDTYKVYIRRGLNSAERVLVDPGQATVSAVYPSPDGRLLAYTVSVGSERTPLHIMTTSTGKDIEIPIPGVLSFGSIDWTDDAKAFFYTRLPVFPKSAPPGERYSNAATYRHVLGTDWSQDRLAIGPAQDAPLRTEPVQWPFVHLPYSSRWALAEITNGVANERILYFAPRQDAIRGTAKWRKIAAIEDEVTDYSLCGDDLYLVTRRRVMKLTLPYLRMADARPVLSNSAMAPTAIGAAREALYVVVREGPASELVRVPYRTGEAEKVSLPIDGIPQLYSTDPRFEGALIMVQGWTRGQAIYAVHGDSIGDTKLRPPSLAEQKLELQVTNVRVKSHDGVEIPLTIVGRLGMARNGSNMTYLVGYGSYGTSMDPFFDPVVLAWYERGGILAVAHVRGGGEFGEEWHRAGQKATKANTWRDFIACAEYLVAERYTRPGRLAGGAVSAGGILIGRAITERPELFRAALIGAGTTDMLRGEFQKNGAVNIPEFGTVKNADDFPALWEMSAYHHVNDGLRYPSVLLTTGTNDPVVDPWQAAKMAARLQAATASGRPVLLRPTRLSSSWEQQATRRKFGDRGEAIIAGRL